MRLQSLTEGMVLIAAVLLLVVILSGCSGTPDRNSYMGCAFVKSCNLTYVPAASDKPKKEKRNVNSYERYPTPYSI